MNILFLSLSKMADINARGIYRDLIRHIAQNGHSITVAYPIEKRENDKTNMSKHGTITLLPVRIGNITKCRNKIEKGLSTILLQHHYIRAINIYCSAETFDLILYATPPITFSSVVKKVKKKHGAKSYLMLKDIFPQNALDIGLLPSWGPWKLLVSWFKHQERELYKISDFIGCMSPRNVTYLLEKNADIPSEKVEVCPNSIEPIDKETVSREKRNSLQPLTFLYGGNLGKPQGIPFLLDCLTSNMNKHDRRFIICGTGTEASLLESFIKKHQPNNITFIPGLPVAEYEELVTQCDIGMIFLDHRFTIPNFPSRILSYMEKSIPVLACTDPNTDMGKIITENRFGWWVESNNVDSFNNLVETLCNLDQKTLSQFGMNARTYLEEHYTVENTYKTIMKHFT
jgi:glycosyltransferase involved in cell wall biosynthesis